VLSTDLIEAGDVTGNQVIEATPDRVERALAREDLCGLLQRLVLIDRDEHRCGTTATGDRHVFTPVGDLVEQVGEVGAELSHGTVFDVPGAYTGG
jgi:hypothetical protein